MDCSLPGSSVHGIFQARIQEWVAISFSRKSSQPRNQACISCIAGRLFTTEQPGKPFWSHVVACNLTTSSSRLGKIISLIPSVRYLVGLMLCAQLLSCVSLFVTSWTIACQGPLSMGCSRQEYWSGLPCPLQRIFLTQGLNPHLLHWPVDSLSLSHSGKLQFVM